MYSSTISISLAGQTLTREESLVRVVGVARGWPARLNFNDLEYIMQQP